MLSGIISLPERKGNGAEGVYASFETYLDGIKRKRMPFYMISRRVLW
jgi:hypothetical protein